MSEKETLEDGLEDKMLPYVRLWTRVVSGAVQDTCARPDEYAPGQFRLTADARYAMDWLFDAPVGGFILELLGIDPGSFEKRLARAMLAGTDTLFTRMLPNEKRQYFKINYALWCAGYTAGPLLQDLPKPNTYAESKWRGVPGSVLPDHGV